MVDTTPAPIQPPIRLATENAQRYELTLSDYWRILVKRRFFILLTFLSVLAGAIIYTRAQTPLYSSNATVKITQSMRAFGDERAYFVPQLSGDPLAVYESSITSEKVMKLVAIQLQLVPKNGGKEELDAKAAELRGTVSTRILGSTDMIRITVTYTDPDMAAAIANSIAHNFARVDLNEKTKQARTVRQFVENQLQIFEKKLKDTEEQIQTFRQSGKALGIAIGMEERVQDLQKQKTELQQIFTDNHPDVIKLDELIKNVQSNIKSLPSNELNLARLQRELEIYDSAFRMMKERYENARLAEVEQVSDVSVADTAIPNRNPVSPKKNLNKLLGSVVGLVLGIVIAFGVESLDTSIGTIEDVERTIRLPVVGIVPYFNPQTHNARWWRLDSFFSDWLGRRFMEAVPNSSALIMNQDSFSTLAEAYRILRTFVEFLMDKNNKEGKVLMITSTGPQEGKSLTSSNLAISLAQAGKKTLLIDTDLRRPVVHRLFGIKRSPGLAEVLMGTSSFDETRRTMGDFLVGENSKWDQVLATKMLDRLEILTTGEHTHSPAELLASDAMKRLLDLVRLKYDYIILDTPPVLPVTDARTLGAFADVTLFVYRAGKTARRALIRAKDELRLAGVTVKGIILNHATPEVSLTDQYYYQYYGDKKGKK